MSNYTNRLTISSNTSADEDARISFKHGVEWFKKALWHKASEEPEEQKQLLVQYDNMGEVDYEIDMNGPGNTWRDNILIHKISMWCYIEDILPKEGEG